jgi:hypothetical protein
MATCHFCVSDFSRDAVRIPVSSRLFWRSSQRYFHVVEGARMTT